MPALRRTQVYLLGFVGCWMHSPHRDVSATDGHMTDFDVQVLARFYFISPRHDGIRVRLNRLMARQALTR